jgi:hypothetical protein
VKQILIAGLALLTLGVMASAANAGCLIQVTYKNKLNRAVVVNKQQTKVRAPGVVAGVPNVGWSTFLAHNINVPANKTIKRNATLDLPCAAGHRIFKFYIVDGNNIIRVKKTVAIPIDQKINVKIK